MVARAAKLAAARAKLAEIGGTTIERHIFLCAMSEKQKCCSRAQGRKSWNYLKDRLNELGLAGPKRYAGRGTICGGVQRTKADCLQICTAGPIALIWPDLVWYHSASEDVLERIIQDHLIGGKVVEEFQLLPGARR